MEFRGATLRARKEENEPLETICLLESGSLLILVYLFEVCQPETTEIGRVKCWISTEGLRQKEVLDRETGMVYDAKTTTTTNLVDT